MDTSQASQSPRRLPTTVAIKRLSELKTDWTLAMQEIETDFVCLQILSRAVPRSTLVELVASRVQTGARTHLVYVAVSVPALHRLLGAAGWESFAPDRLHLSRHGEDEFTHGQVAVCLVRTADARELADMVFGAVFNEFMVDDPNRLTLHIEECSPREVTRRFEELGRLGRLIPRRGTSRSRGIAIASCRICGQPLSDPESVKIGIGPECRRRHLGAGARRVLANPGLDRIAMVSALPERVWRARAVRDAGAALSSMAPEPPAEH